MSKDLEIFEFDDEDPLDIWDDESED